MNSPYQSYQKTQEAGGPPANLGQILQNFASQFVPAGMDPERMVRQLVQSGQMSQDQFNQLAVVADRWTGRRR